MANTTPSEISDAAVETHALGGRVRLLQLKEGYRAGMDAALLAAGVAAKPGDRWLEAGCGVGAALLQAAARAPEARFTGVERAPRFHDLAVRNIRLNGLEDRCAAVLGDVGAGFASLGLPRFDGAFANPPYFDDPSALRLPAPGKTAAFLSQEGLKAWCAFLLSAVRDGGTLLLIHRADRLADLLAGLGSKAGSFKIRPIASRPDAAAKRVLVRAVRQGRAPLELLPPLVMHSGSGETGPAPTPESDALLRAAARLSWLATGSPLEGA